MCQTSNAFTIFSSELPANRIFFCRDINGTLLGTSANITCYDSGRTADLNNVNLTNFGTGLFNYTFSNTLTVDSYSCFINCYPLNPTFSFIIEIRERFADNGTLTAVKTKTDTIPLNLPDNTTLTSIKTQTDKIPTLGDNLTLTAVKTKTDTITINNADNTTLTYLISIIPTTSAIWTFSSKNATCVSVLDKTGYSLTTADWTTDSDLTPLATSLQLGQNTTALLSAISSKSDNATLTAISIILQTAIQQNSTNVKLKIDDLNSSIIITIINTNLSIQTKLNLLETEATALSRYNNLTAQILGKGGSNLTTTDLDAYCDLINYAYVWNQSQAITNASIYGYFTDGTNENQFKADVSGLATTAQLSQNTSALLASILGRGSSNLTLDDLNNLNISIKSKIDDLNNSVITLVTGANNSVIERIILLESEATALSRYLNLTTQILGKGGSNLTTTDLDTYCDTKSDIWTFGSKNVTATSVLDKSGYSLITQDWETEITAAGRYLNTSTSLNGMTVLILDINGSIIGWINANNYTALLNLLEKETTAESRALNTSNKLDAINGSISSQINAVNVSIFTKISDVYNYVTNGSLVNAFWTYATRSLTELNFNVADNTTLNQVKLKTDTIPSNLPDNTTLNLVKIQTDKIPGLADNITVSNLRILLLDVNNTIVAEINSISVNVNSSAIWAERLNGNKTAGRLVNDTYKILAT